MAPEKSSARPARMTRRGDPSDERPAVRAKGTVRPSLKPMMKLRIRSPWFACRSVWTVLSVVVDSRYDFEVDASMLDDCVEGSCVGRV